MWFRQTFKRSLTYEHVYSDLYNLFVFLLVYSEKMVIVTSGIESYEGVSPVILLKGWDVQLVSSSVTVSKVALLLTSLGNPLPLSGQDCIRLYLVSTLTLTVLLALKK